MPYVRSPIFGGSGGNAFSDDLTEVDHLVAITVNSGTFVDGFRCQWSMTDGTTIWSDWHGGGGGNAATFTLNAGEAIVKVTGNAGRYIDQIGFVTNLGNIFGPVGGNGGTQFSISGKVVGFFGNSGTYLDAVGAFIPAESFSNSGDKAAVSVLAMSK